MLEMNFFSAPPMCDLIQRNLDHFCSSIVDPRNTPLIEPDMSMGYCRHSLATPMYRSSAADSMREAPSQENLGRATSALSAAMNAVIYSKSAKAALE